MAKVSTLTATCVAFGTTYVLVCRRGVPDVDYGKIYSAGGSIDSSETAPGAAVRELHEESGVVVDVSSLKQIFPYSNSKVMHYIVNIDPSIIITGPSLQHRWEVLTSETQICGVPVIPGTGWTWVQLDDLRRAGEDSEFSKNVLPFIG
jgi:8-oxo-dGTP pyrophosphatase MutT (NUDIX family)